MKSLFGYLLDRRGKNKKDNRNKGATMIVAIIIMSILVIFTFSLALVAYTLYASQNKNVASMKCSETANTFNQALEYELTHEGDNFLDSPTFQSYLYKYIRINMCQKDTWPYYNPEEPLGHSKEYAFRYFDLRYNQNTTSYGSDDNVKTKEDGSLQTLNDVGVEGMPGRTEVCIYWMLPDGVETSDDNLSAAGESRNGVRLFVEITSEAASQSYTVTSEYLLRIASYQDLHIKNELMTACSSVDTAINPQGIQYNSINIDEYWKWERIVGE